MFCIGCERKTRSRGVEPAGSCLVNNILSAASFYGRPQYRGRQDQAPRTHNSQDSLRDALEVVSYSFLQLLKRPCRMHLLPNGLSLQLRRERPKDRASLLLARKNYFCQYQNLSSLGVRLCLRSLEGL